MTREEQAKALREQLETSRLDAMTPQQAAKILRSANLGGVLRTAAELGAEALERLEGTMERLTMDNGLCQMASTEFCISQKDCYSCPHGRKCFKRLAAYEDTGLDPEDIDALRKREQGLVELLTNISCGCTVSYDRLRELARAEKDGRLVVLPCNVGGTVWTNIAIVGSRYKSADKPYPVEVVFIGIGKDDRFFHVQYESGTVFPFDYEKVGKTVFLTREEAEAALKKREEA